MLKYRALFERYRGLIAGGAYAPGERLPSLRDVAEEEGLGLNTVRAAFDLLESEGLARARERGGYYARGRAGRRPLDRYVPPSDCRETEGLSTTEKIEYLLAFGAEVAGKGEAFGFALAEPDSGLLPAARLERLHASLSGSWIDYGDQSGEEELRRRITAAYHPYHAGLEPEYIVVTAGATEAIGIAFRALLEPGDEVAVESPTYYDFFRQLSAARARIVEVPVAPGLGIDLDLLKSRLRRGAIKMIVVQPNVQNPTGSIMPDEAKRRLVELASRYGAILVQDDVYGDLAFPRLPSRGGAARGESSPLARPANLSVFGDYEGIVYISSFSKCLAPGLRIGWMRSTGLGPRLLRAKSLTSLATNRPAQRVLAAYLAGSSFKKHLAAMRASLEAQLAGHMELLAGALPDGSSIAQPEGGCLLWLALPKGCDASRVFETAAREGIFVAPGELFSANPYFRGHVRINFGYRLTERRRAALARLGAIIREESSRRAR